MIYSIITLIIVVIGFILVLYFVSSRFKSFEEKQKSDQSLLILNQSLQGMQGRIDETTKAINERLDRAAQVISQVTQELGGMKEIGHQIKGFQDFLKSPKMRGQIGEQVMQDLLEQYLSRQQFELQYKFRSGERVDAIIKTKEGIIPIDAKFPLESFQRYLAAKSEEEQEKLFKECVKSVRARIDEISKKYILPEEGTVDFAIMYIPSEVVYYEIIRSKEGLDDYGRQKNVYFVSPNSFYYFLRIVMIGMRGQQIQEEAKKILDILLAIQQDTKKLGQVLGLVTTHVTNAKNAVDRMNNEYAKLTGKIEQIKLLK
ncbi:MAG: DNA recombination protein RmuC [Minisyncoccia bacterium]